MHIRVRWTLPSLILVSGLGLAGCFTIPVSLNPAFPASSAVSLPGIEGLWVEAGGETRLRIRAGGDAAYELIVFEKGGPAAGQAPFELRFARIGDQLFWDLTPAAPRADLGLRRVHLPARVLLEDGVLEVAFLAQDPLRQALASGELALAHALAGGDLVLTGSSGEVAAFLEDHGGSEALFDEPSRFERHGAPRR